MVFLPYALFLEGKNIREQQVTTAPKKGRLALLYRVWLAGRASMQQLH